MIKILNIIVLTLFFSSIVYSQDMETRDPFEDIFPKRIAEEIKVERTENIKEKPDIPLPEFDIQGVLWGTDKPQTIIDGKIYNIGDKIGSMDLTVIKIEDNKVFFLYKEKVYEKKARKTEVK